MRVHGLSFFSVSFLSFLLLPCHKNMGILDLNKRAEKGGRSHKVLFRRAFIETETV